MAENVGQMSWTNGIDSTLLAGATPIGTRHIEGVYHTHSQLVPLDTWPITHNLGRFPSVTVVDSGGAVVVGNVFYVDANHVILTFTGAFAGVAYLN